MRLGRATTGTVFTRNPPPPAVVDAALGSARDACAWLEDVADAATYPTLVGRVDADLVVVGGGYCGLWTAVLAKQRNPGARVVLLEAGAVGWAASGRNGGFCAASLTHGEENGRSRWPEEYDLLERMGRENLDGIERAVADLGLDCDYERTGELDVATEPYQVDALREGGGPVLDTDAVRALVNSPTYLAGVLHDDVALVHPARLAKELARAASELGVEVFERTPAARLTAGRGAATVTVGTPSGEVRAARVALATNVFRSLVPRYRPYTVPVYDYALMTEPLSGEQLASIGWTGRQGVGDTANLFHYYRLTTDRRILWGGYDAVYHFGRRVQVAHESRPQTHRLLAEHFFTTFPQLEGLRFSHRWAGAIDTCTRFCAFYGLAKQGRVAYAAGFTGLGVGATRFAADVMLDLLSGETTPRTELRMVRQKPLPFPPEPLTSVGVQATRWSLERADRREGRRNLWLRALDAAGLGFDS